MPAWINLPNLLTLLRLLLAPLVIRAILAGQHVQALALFTLAAVTDVLDGAAARRWHASTPTGAYFDPIADKCLLSGVYLALAVAGIVPWLFVAIVFGRDIYILAGSAFVMLVTAHRKFPPSIWGKVSTFVQISTAVVWMARDVIQSPAMDSFAAAMLWPCGLFTIWSGLHYTWIGVHTLRTH